MVTLNDLPGVAEVAMQGSLHAANTIVRRLDGEDDAKPFKYRDLGSVAAIGRFRAICSVGKLRLSGFAGWCRLVLRAPRVPQRVGQSGRDDAALERWLVGRQRVERVFSVAHTGGDLSTPATVRSVIEPNPLPARSESTAGDRGGKRTP